MKKIMTEGTIQKAILTYLEWYSKSHKIYWFRSGAGMVKTEAGGVFRSGKPGVPDISVCYKGVYWGIEVKSKTGRQSALQKQAEAEIVAAGGRYHIVRSISDVKSLFPMEQA